MANADSSNHLSNKRREGSTSAEQAPTGCTRHLARGPDWDQRAASEKDDLFLVRSSCGTEGARLQEEMQRASVARSQNDDAITSTLSCSSYASSGGLLVGYR